VVCVGGGGLLSGSLIASEAVQPGIQVVGVEPEVANDCKLSLDAGSRLEISPPDTIADGLRSQKPGEITFPIVQKLVKKVLLVSEEEIRATVRFAITRMKIVIEPSGAVAAAAALHGKVPQGPKRIGILVTGGNIDLELLADILRGA